MAFTFLRAEWRKLIMAQYEVEPAALVPYLPAGLELDLYGGRCFVSLVGFLFDRVRLLGAEIPGHGRFEEINLRFYVCRRLPDGSVRRGVVFLSEIVPRPAISWTARALYGESYATAATEHRWEIADGQLEVVYDWRNPGWRPDRRWNSLAVRSGRVPQFMVPGGLDEFITEHYFGYTGDAGRRTSEYAVEHPRWLVYPVAEHRIVCDFAGLYGRFGNAFGELGCRAPDHVLLAEGSPIGIRWGGRLR